MLPIIYVHLGDKPAGHLINSIRQSRRMAKTSDIYAILTPNTVMAPAVKDAGAQVIYADGLPPTASHRSYIGSVRRRLGKKRGFWRFATERFFFIEELMIKLGLDRVLHLESDNFIFFDPADIEDKLRALYRGMAAPFWNDNLCIPGVVYIGDRRVLGELTTYLAERVRAEAARQARWYRPSFLTRVRMGLVLNDMNMLADFKREFGPEKLELLPMVPPGYDAGNQAVPHEYPYDHGYEELGMMFDGCAIGPGLHGMDPTHHTPAATASLLRQYSFVDPKTFGLDQIDLREPSKTPYVAYRGHAVRLASLHNHAKVPIA